MNIAGIALAPHGRMTQAMSHTFVDLILGGWLVVAVGLAALFAYFAWSRAKKLSTEVWHKRGLAQGPIFLPGTALPLDEDAATDGGRPFIELTIDQSGEQRRNKSNHYVIWTETSRQLTERPFLLQCDNGERVRVEPSGRVDLIDRLDVTTRLGAAMRRRSARIVNGEKVWIRGVLTDTTLGGMGPYRGGGASHRWVLSPPARGALFVSSEPVEAEGRAEARFHVVFASLYVVLLMFCQGVLFHDYRALRRDGVLTQARVVDRVTWITRSKNSSTTHYGLRIEYQSADGRSWKSREETSASAYRFVGKGDDVPVVYAPAEPDVVELGAYAEVGVGAGPAMAGLILGIILTICYLVFNATRRPWWRRKVLVEQVNGKL